MPTLRRRYGIFSGVYLCPYVVSIADLVGGSRRRDIGRVILSIQAYVRLAGVGAVSVMASRMPVFRSVSAEPCGSKTARLSISCLRTVGAEPFGAAVPERVIMGASVRDPTTFISDGELATLRLRGIAGFLRGSATRERIADAFGCPCVGTSEVVAFIRHDCMHFVVAVGV